ncbi:MAG: thioredoxin domain-containing protein [Candidatus Hodarchaeales archaeon]
MKEEPKKGSYNRLVNASSPYLLQHAKDPVDWFEWEEGLVEAKRLNKPLLLSIGYAACHWCHVMHQESFSDEVTARIMNDLFVNVKIDREERPDLDFYFQTQVAFLTNGRGGWPLTVFCTSEGKAFSGGTYFPKDSAYGLPSFKQVLKYIHRKYYASSDQIEELTKNLQKLSVERYEVGVIPEEYLTIEIIDDFLERLVNNYDESYGGFGNTGPKFPQVTELRFLLSQYYRKGMKQEILDIVINSFDKMSSGGIYDHIGYGFHRYSVDRNWLVPHFEKMLYDNAQILLLATELFQITGLRKYKDIAQEIILYLKREMLSPEGGFYSSQDADMDGKEGSFFIWSKDEIKEVLGDIEGEQFARYFNISEKGNFENGYSILSRSKYLESEMEKDPKVKEKVEEYKKKLFAYRENRKKPFVNENIILSWNALIIGTLGYASFVMKEEEYFNLANKTLQYILSDMKDKNSYVLYRNSLKGKKNSLAFSEDYSLLIQALLTLFSISGNREYLLKAINLQKALDDKFWDRSAGVYFVSSRDLTDFTIPDKPVVVFSMPSSNSVSLENLTRLYFYTGEQEFQRKAERLSKFLIGWSKTHGHLNGDGFQALDLFLNKSLEIIAIKKENEICEDSAIFPLLQSYISQSILLITHKSHLARLMDLVLIKDKIKAIYSQESENDIVFICKDFVCSLPLTSANEVKTHLV